MSEMFIEIGFKGVWVLKMVKFNVTVLNRS